MSDIDNQSQDDDGTSLERFDRNLAAVCQAIVQAGGTKVIIEDCDHNGVTLAELDHDLTEEDLSDVKDVAHYACVEGEIVVQKVSLTRALDSLIDDIKGRLLDNVEYQDCDIDATIDAELGRMTAQVNSVEEVEQVLAKPGTLLQEDERAKQAALLRQAMFVAMAKVNNTGVPVVRSEVPGVATTEQADAYNVRAIMSVLKKAGVSKAELLYAGSGDRGDYWQWKAQDVNGLPMELRFAEGQKVMMCDHPCHGPLVTNPDLVIKPVLLDFEKAMDLLCQRVLIDHHFAYEEQLGGGGQLTLDVNTRDITWQAYNNTQQRVDRGHFQRDVDLSKKTLSHKP